MSNIFFFATFCTNLCLLFNSSTILHPPLSSPENKTFGLRGRHQDNGPQPRQHRNLLPDIKELNSWIVFFNKQNGKDITPRFHRYGVRDGWTVDREGKRVRIKKHTMSQWCSAEPVAERVHLNPDMRIRLGVAVTRHFQGELERNGKIG